MTGTADLEIGSATDSPSLLVDSESESPDAFLTAWDKIRGSTMHDKKTIALLSTARNNRLW